MLPLLSKTPGPTNLNSLGGYWKQIVTVLLRFIGIEVLIMI